MGGKAFTGSPIRISALTIVGLALAVTLVLTGSGALADVLILKRDKYGESRIKKLDLKEREKTGTGKGAAGAENPARLNDPGDPSYPSDPDDRFEPGELVVMDPPKGFVAAVAGLGFTVSEAVRLDGLDVVIYRLRLPKGLTVPAARKRLSGRFPGLAIDANHQFEASRSKAAARAATYATARAVMGWKNASPLCGTGVRLGMVDSSVDLNHPALKGQRIELRSFHRKSKYRAPAVHGTAIAAMLVGKPIWGGLLPGAELKAASIFRFTKRGHEVSSALGLLKGLNWLAKARVDAINLSTAGADNKVVRKAFDKLKKLGVVLVAPVGNFGRADKPIYPAAYKDVITVTAVGAGRVVYNKANMGDYIDFAAPGVEIWTATAGGGGRIFSGTSFAVPYITAVLGLRVAGGARKRATLLKKGLRRHTIDLGLPGKDAVFGYGFVNLEPKCRK